MFYKIVGDSEQKTITFPFKSLGDFKPHTLVLTVAGQLASLHVDKALVGIQALDGFVDDCGKASPSCITHIGRRTGGFPMSGCVAEATVRPVEAKEDDEEEEDGGGTEVFDLLNVRRCFDSERTDDALMLTEFPPITGTQMTIEVAFAIQAGTYGYLFSKGKESSSQRFYAVYLRRSDHKLILYYTATGSTRQQSLTLLDTPITQTAAAYTLAVHISGTEGVVVLKTTSERGEEVETVNLALVNPIDDCGSIADDCSFRIGERTGGLKLNGGCINTLTVKA